MTKTKNFYKVIYPVRGGSEFSKERYPVRYGVSFKGAVAMLFWSVWDSCWKRTIFLTVVALAVAGVAFGVYAAVN